MTPTIPLVVGCPVSHRQWALDVWFDHVEAAVKVADLDYMYAFVGDPTRDRSFEVIERRAHNVAIIEVPNLRSEDRRDWGLRGRFAQMVELRNTLLGSIRIIAPTMFLSLDSDIMIHPDAIAMLADDVATGPYAAVGGKCYMTPTGLSCPSWARLDRRGGIQRSDAAGYFPVDVIMAIKMMSPPAYAIDYELHTQGEDVGWSIAARRAGLTLGWDGRVTSKHVMAPHLMGRIDPRVGY